MRVVASWDCWAPRLGLSLRLSSLPHLSGLVTDSLALACLQLVQDDTHRAPGMGYIRTWLGCVSREPDLCLLSLPSSQPARKHASINASHLCKQPLLYKYGPFYYRLSGNLQTRLRLLRIFLLAWVDTRNLISRRRCTKKVAAQCSWFIYFKLQTKMS